MRKILLWSVLAVMAGCGAASAGGWENMYYDARRTGGHKRSDGAFQGDMRFCARKAGIPYSARAHDLAISQPDPPAFKQCMAGRGLAWQWARPKYDPPRWTFRHNHPDDAGTTDNSPPPPPAFVPQPPDPPSPPLSIYDPQVNPGVFMHRDDQPSNW